MCLYANMQPMIQTRTCTQSLKAKPTAAVTQLLSPSEPALGCLAPLRHLSLVHAENFPGTGLVTCMRAVQVSRIEIVEPKVPQLPHTVKGDKGSRVFAFPVFTRYPLMLLLGGLLPQSTPGH